MFISGDIELPLDQRQKQAGRGEGFLDLRDMKVTPKGALKVLLELGGVDTTKPVPLSTEGIHFRIRDGRIYCDEFNLIFDKDFDLGFRGSVGFDDTVDMSVTVPVRAGLFRRFGIGGPIADYARLLEGVRVVIPIIGNRIKPDLDFSEVDIGSLVNKAIEQFRIEQIGKTVEDLLKGTSDPNTGPALKKLPLDILFELIENSNNTP